MAAAVGKGSAQNINSVYFKPMLRKAYHRKSSTTWPDMVGGDHDSSVGSGSEEKEEEEVKAGSSNHHHHHNVVESFVNARGAGRENHHHHHHNDDHVSWVPDNRTGIYYPKGQEKVMEDVSPLAGKDLSVNWFSHP